MRIAGTWTYDDLMTLVPKAERTRWHRRAIEAAEGPDLRSLMDLLLQTRELDRLADLLRRTEARALEELSHHATEPVCARARRCFERAGLLAEWEDTVGQVRADHHRKTGFMSGLERLVAGSAPRDEPSFLERARTRWGGRPGRAR